MAADESQPQLKPRRRDKATAAARRAWAQIAKPVTEETFTAWYIANVAKQIVVEAAVPPGLWALLQERRR